MAVSFDDVVSAALTLPEVAQSTSYNTPSLKVKGKIMGRLRTEAEGALALRCDFLDREMLMQADPTTFFITDHYNNYPMVLINLKTLRRAALPQLLEAAWRLSAPMRLIQTLDGVVPKPRRQKTSPARKASTTRSAKGRDQPKV